MKLITKEKNLKPRRKIFPGLGGIKKKYIRKGKILLDEIIKKISRKIFKCR